MREILDRYIRKFHRDHQKRRKAIALFVVLSLLVSGSVTWRLKSDGIAMTNEAFCGKEEHQHSEACYTEVLMCGLGRNRRSSPFKRGRVLCRRENAYLYRKRAYTR